MNVSLPHGSQARPVSVTSGALADRSGDPDPAVEQLWPADVPVAHSLDDIRLADWNPRRMAVTATTPTGPAAYPMVDAHNHLGRWLTGAWAAPDVPALIDLMDEHRVASVVNLDGRWGSELEANLERYDRTWPGRFATFCHVDWSVLTLSAVAASAAMVAGLRASAASGARGVKVWKDLGLYVRDGRDELVLLDDPRFGDLLETAGELGLPVFVHTADPVAFFEPVDGHNERLEQLLACPQWSFADRTRYPSFERLLEALEGVVAAHPHTTFVGLHAGGWGEDLGQVSRMLHTYPNYSVDLAARLPELGRQPRASAALIREYQGRVLLGTDSFPLTAQALEAHVRFFETHDECYDHDDFPALDGRWTISALALEGPALEALYAGAARSLVPGL